MGLTEVLTSPVEVCATQARAMTIGTPPLTPIGEPPNNLPVPSTSFVGREQQIDAVIRLLASTRLLTLTGAGGCGKTQLALHVAADFSDTYADGVWLVELAALSDPALVARAVAQAVSVREVPGRAVIDSVVDHLRERASLLILDKLRARHRSRGACRRRLAPRLP